MLTSSFDERGIRIVLAALAATLATPCVAQAQIYSWRDPSGNLVLSDHPKDSTQRTYAVGTTGAIRTTRAGARSELKREADRHTERNASCTASSASAASRRIRRASPAARSVKGAMGLMQLHAATAIAFGVANPYDPAENIRAGSRISEACWTATRRTGTRTRGATRADGGREYKAVPPYRETRDYVAKITKQAGSRPAPLKVYKVVEFKDGREIVRYTNTPPGGQGGKAESR